MGDREGLSVCVGLIAVGVVVPLGCEDRVRVQVCRGIVGGSVVLNIADFNVIDGLVQKEQSQVDNVWVVCRVRSYSGTVENTTTSLNILSVQLVLAEIHTAVESTATGGLNVNVAQEPAISVTVDDNILESITCSEFEGLRRDSGVLMSIDLTRLTGGICELEPTDGVDAGRILPYLDAHDGTVIATPMSFTSLGAALAATNHQHRSPWSTSALVTLREGLGFDDDCSGHCS